MKHIAIVAALGAALLTTQAEAKGCIKGAVVGGAAGHLAHHGLLGAVAGCAYGMHRAHQQQRLQTDQPDPTQPQPQPQSY